MDIDHIPTPGDLDTQWRPIWEKVTYDRFGSNWLTTTVRQ